MSKLKKFIEQLKYQYSPTIPDVDFKNAESRRNWILYMAHRLGKVPVRELYAKLVPHVSKVTVNHDMQVLEGQGLIKRIRENIGTKDSTSYVLPLFEDSGEEKQTNLQRRKEVWLNFGLPGLNVLLLIFLFAVHLAQ